MIFTFPARPARICSETAQPHAPKGPSKGTREPSSEAVTSCVRWSKAEGGGTLGAVL